MKKIATFLILFSLSTLNSCKGQKIKEYLKISDFKFKSIFGLTSKEPQNNYCLLGSGFFRTPRSENSDSLVIDWINKHREAIVVPVSSFGPAQIKDKDSKIIYCWVIDKKDTLNNYLIKKGCFPGGTMLRPKTWDEMEKREEELYRNSDEKSDVKVYVDKKWYNIFIEQIKVAELYARKNKLGIWYKEQEE
ncbi:hypothetical protein ACFOG5_09905 [Pedobacter fastidiosus]|uniref:Endonuclease YncB, thermonuclease family n=1 Tax=Pedobacter fastidiosus TaxID=2765361 RepID=A0ABR7KYQ3_9SPHI|nr:hypothetical protein [Pedobacter fastidiosus]MBC6112955.1 hypothetical protein [Pedobacter fastidiosus]